MNSEANALFYMESSSELRGSSKEEKKIASDCCCCCSCSYYCRWSDLLRRNVSTTTKATAINGLLDFLPEIHAHEFRYYSCLSDFGDIRNALQLAATKWILAAVFGTTASSSRLAGWPEMSEQWGTTALVTQLFKPAHYCERFNVQNRIVRISSFVLSPTESQVLNERGKAYVRVSNAVDFVCLFVCFFSMQKISRVRQRKKVQRCNDFLLNVTEA